MIAPSRFTRSQKKFLHQKKHLSNGPKNQGSQDIALSSSRLRLKCPRTWTSWRMMIAAQVLIALNTMMRRGWMRIRRCRSRKFIKTIVICRMRHQRINSKHNQTLEIARLASKKTTSGTMTRRSKSLADSVGIALTRLKIRCSSAAHALVELSLSIWRVWGSGLTQKWQNLKIQGFANTSGSPSNARFVRPPSHSNSKHTIPNVNTTCTTIK